MERQVKNRAPAEVQVTAEQLVRAARGHMVNDERKMEDLRRSTKVTDEEELKMHQAERRQEFEDKLGHSLVKLGAWLRYAKWEESQMEYRRARSIFERALESEHRNYQIWLKYAEFEMRNKFVNHARNVLDRAVTHLPRVNQLWFKYTYFEEVMGQADKARLIYERWMHWEPSEQAWLAYANFEMRQGDPVRARNVYERMCGCHPRAKTYIKYAKWEESNAQLALARIVFERALEELDKTEAHQESFLIAFAKFEERCKEYERTRAIYKQGLELLPKAESRQLYDEFVAFERQHGDRDSIEGVLISKRRTQYEAKVKAQPHDYDSWFDFTKMEQAQALAEAKLVASRDYMAEDDREYAQKQLLEARDRVRTVYDRAVSHIPPSKKDKRLWKRYIYLWINYALFEELHLEDMEKARLVYSRCLATIPHEKFTFSKIWIMAAHFEVRQKDLTAARKMFGRAIGMCPREKVFKAYIQMELQLGNVDRCRTLFEKYLEFSPQNGFVWQKFAELEQSVGEIERARSIFELAMTQPVLDMPENLWKRYIDFEISLNTKDALQRARELYGRLLERTDHVKVWISFAKFEMLHNKQNKEAGREIFSKAYDRLKEKQKKSPDDIEIKENRALLLQSWLEEEEKLGAKQEAEKLQSLQPQKVKRKRQIEDDGGWEEYYDFIFPDDPKKGLKLLQLAKKWKESKKPKTEDTNELDIDDEL